MAKRKRGPPISYEQKYRQIKKSPFKVDIPRPTTPSTKGMVTRYHRYLFGKSGKAGIVRSYRPYKGKYVKEAMQEFKKPKGSRRIEGAIIQKGRTISHVTKDYIDVQHKHIIERRYKLRREAMVKNPDKEIARVLTPVGDKRFQIYIGKSILPNEYKSIRDAITAYHEARKKYSDRVEQIGVMTMTTRYQSSRRAYKRMTRRGKKD